MIFSLQDKRWGKAAKIENWRAEDESFVPRMHWLEECALENNWGVTDKIRYMACDGWLELWVGFVSGWFLQTDRPDKRDGRWYWIEQSKSFACQIDKQRDSGSSSWLSTLHVQLLLSVIGPQDEQLKSEIVFLKTWVLQLNGRFPILGIFFWK